MAINIRDAVNGDGLFDIAGKYMEYLETFFLAVGTTVPAKYDTAGAQYKLKTDATSDMDAIFSQVPVGLTAWQNSAPSLTSPVEQFLRGWVPLVVDADAPQPDLNLKPAMTEVIVQMVDQGFFVGQNAVTLALAADALNSSTDVAIAFSDLRGDGREVENALAEIVSLEVTTAGVAPTISFKGEASVGLLDINWPKGSGASTSVTANRASGSLLTNGDFQDEDSNTTDLPDKWIITVGVASTDFLLTDPEIQTITVVGSPTTGSMTWSWSNPDSINRSTTPLAFNASASVAQTALRKIPGLEAVTVTLASSVYTITFDGVAGNVSEMTATDQFDTGSLTVATSTQGDLRSFRGRALGIVGDGSTKPAISSTLSSLSVETVYFVSLRHLKSGTPAAGIVRIAILDAIGGSVTTDPEGNNNSTTFDLTSALSIDVFTHDFFSFRLQKNQTLPVYLEIQTTTAISSGTSYYIDEMAVVQGTELYAGGPFVATFGGKTAAIEGDKWNLTVTNDRAGKVQEFWNRVFDMADLELLLPISGSTLIPDTVIS